MPRTGCPMADRKLSSKTRRRLRLNVARRLSGQLASTDTATKRKCPAEIEGRRERCGPGNETTGTSSVNLSARLTSTDAATETQCPEFDDSEGGCNETSSGLFGHTTPTDAAIYMYRKCPEQEESRSGLGDETSSDSPTSSFGPEEYVESFSDEEDVSSGSELSEALK